MTSAFNGQGLDRRAVIGPTLAENGPIRVLVADYVVCADESKFGRCLLELRGSISTVLTRQECDQRRTNAPGPEIVPNVNREKLRIFVNRPPGRIAFESFLWVKLYLRID